MHLSYSQIYLFRECAKLWQASYRQGKKQVGDNNLVFGSGIHDVVEHRIAGQVPNLLEYWKHIWWTKYAIQEKIAWHLSQDECYETGVRIFSSKQVVSLVDKIEPKKWPDKSAMIERKIEWHLPGLPPIVGYIDCIASDGVPIDFKTAANMWSPGQAKKEMQPLFYMASLNEALEFDHEYRFRHLIFTKGQFPVARVFETTRSPEQVEELKTYVLEVWAKISAAEFTPNPNSWLCNTACPVFDECIPAQEKFFGKAI